jgi:hypothetical protein
VEQIDVIRRLVEKYPAYLRLVNTAAGMSISTYNNTATVCIILFYGKVFERYDFPNESYLLEIKIIANDSNRFIVE